MISKTCIGLHRFSTFFNCLWRTWKNGEVFQRVWNYLKGFYGVSEKFIRFKEFSEDLTVLILYLLIYYKYFEINKCFKICSLN